MAQVFLGMSGGVDSSAAAVLLLERGYCVHGLHLSLLNTLPLPENCPPEDGSDARAVAQALELPFHDLDLSERFRQTVAAYFIREYEAGRTPNPCVFCNREIKFGAMWDAAQALGAAEPAALIERNRAIAEAFTVGKDTAPHIRRYYDDLTEQTAKELVV